MITALYSLGDARGATGWFVFWLICGIAYLVLCFLPRENRVKSRVFLILLSFLIGETATDLCWFLYFYPGGVYVNRGIGGMGILLVWPGILLIFSIVIRLAFHKKKE